LAEKASRTGRAALVEREAGWPAMGDSSTRGGDRGNQAAQRVTPDAGSDITSLARVDLNLLVPLQLLLEERSVTRAAIRMGLSQPAMSHALARCRKVLGDELLIRVGTALEPTVRGRSLLEPLRRILREVTRDVLARPEFDPTTSTRRFRVSATSSTALVVLPPLLTLLEREAPGVSIQLMPALDRGDDLIDMPEIDVVLLADRVPSALPRESLYTDRWVVVAAKDNPMTRDGVTLETLATLPHIIFEITEGIHIQPYSALAGMGVWPKVRLRSHDFGLLPTLVGSTGCVAIVQERLARLYADAGLIDTFPLPVEALSLSLDLLFNPRFAQDPACAWLRGQLRRAVGRDDEDAPH
jgi:DNA-binding transcriptional LysR family regulator